MRRSHFYKKSTADILRYAIDLGELIKDQPELFNFDGICLNDKINLCLDYPELKPHLKITANDRLHATLVLNATQLKSSGLYADKQDIIDSNDSLYVALVAKSKTYFDIERYRKCSDRAKGELFTLVPKKVLDEKEPVPRLISSNNMYLLSNSNIWVFKDGHITDFEKYKTDSAFWNNLLANDYKFFSPIFIANLKHMTLATDVRRVFDRFPELFKLLDENVIVDTPLTPKQWALFINSKKGSTKLKDWVIPAEFKEAVRLDIMSDVLSGKSKLSKVLQNAISDVLKEEENEESSEEVQSQP